MKKERNSSLITRKSRISRDSEGGDVVMTTYILASALSVSHSLVCVQDPSKITVTTGSNIKGTEEKKLSKSQQLKKIFQEYGAVGVSLHIGISLISLGMFYMVISR